MIAVSTSEWKTLRNAATSSRMENLPYEQRHFETIREIPDGKRSLQDYLREYFDKAITDSPERHALNSDDA